MIWRFFGGILLLAAAVLAGTQAASSLRTRALQLHGIVDGLEVLRAEISALVPLSEALFRACGSGGCSEKFFRAVAQRMESENRIFFELWNEELIGLPLQRRALISLQVLGAQLGRYDAETQTRALDRCIQELKRLENEAMDKAGAEAGLRLRLAAALGMLLLIVLW